MNRISITVILLFYMTLLYSQVTDKALINSNPLENELITPDFEKFDSIQFEQLKKKETDTDVYGQLDDGRNFVFGNYKVGKSYSESIPDSYFSTLKLYYANNNIKEKGLMFIHGRFKKGIWYYFDETGKLTEAVDHDEPFKFTLEQIFEFCEQENIPVKKEWDVDVDGFYQPRINRLYDPANNECYWVIKRFNYEKQKMETIRIDGVTGEEISREYNDYFE